MKLNINSGRKGNSSYHFSPISLVSLDFGRLQPIMCLSSILADKFSRFSGKGLLRCTPQVFPPFGRMNLKTASFFVPDSQIFSWSSAFHSDNKNWRGQLADSVPVFDQWQINSAFANNDLPGLSTSVSLNPSSAPAFNSFDFSFPASSGRSSGKTNLNYYKLTPFGWKIYAIFKSLGYDFVTYPTDTSAGSSTDHIEGSSTSLSAVPFLAYAKVWNDFFCNSYQSDYNNVSNYLQKIYLNKDVVISGTTYYNSSNFTLSFDLPLLMVKEILVPYESNMYSNAWDNVNAPIAGLNSRINQVGQQSLISPFGQIDYGEFPTLNSSDQGNKHTSTVSGSSVSFSELGHRTLQAFDRFVRRRNLVGSKAVQQLYALFGIEPDEWSKDYVVKLSENSSRVNFSAITSQSDTVSGSNGKPLGAFAGVGLAGYDIDFSYNSNTYGTIISLVWLNIDPILMHGCHPDTLRIKPLDFYNPEYDGNAYRPIPYLELTGAKAAPYDGSGYGKPNKVYGYTNMYNDYRCMRDVVAGAFCDDTTRHFAFMRDYTTLRAVTSTNGYVPPQSNNVQYWHLDGSSDITNPFITDASLGDRFWFCVDWNIECTRPILSPENSFSLDGEGSLSIVENGNGIA